jgi:hypothetical protein
MQESRREMWALYIGLAFTIIPAMIAANLMPDWNVLPFWGWLTIAGVGSAVAGIIATPYWLRGMVAGALAGAGVLLGVWLYVAFRVWLTGNNSFFKIELMIGAILGGGPGLILYQAWARDAARDERAPPPR